MAKQEFINRTDISDVMIERPVSFSIGDKHYSVYPATLGKMQLSSRLIERIGFDSEKTSADIHKILLIKAREKRDDCLRLIAYSTLPGAECLDENKVQDRLADLYKIDDSDIATIVLIILTENKTERIMKQFGIDVEAKRLAEVMKIKKENKNSFVFAGRSVWGTLIDAACERYGWSYQYVLWGISYANLQLLLADQIRSVYLTDDERKRCHVSNDSVIVRAEDTATLNEFIKSQSWR